MTAGDIRGRTKLEVSFRSPWPYRLVHTIHIDCLSDTDHRVAVVMLKTRRI